MLTSREGLPRNAGLGVSPAHQAGSDTGPGSTGTLSFGGGHGHVNAATLCHDVKWPLVPGGVKALEKLSTTW